MAEDRRVPKVSRRDNADKHRIRMNKHLGRRERKARKRQRRGTVSTSQSGWLTFKLGRKKSLEFHGSDWKKFVGCVVDTER